MTRASDRTKAVLSGAAVLLAKGKPAPCGLAFSCGGAAVPFYSPDAAHFGLLAAIDRAVLDMESERESSVTSLHDLAAEAERAADLLVRRLDADDGIDFPLRATARETLMAWARAKPNRLLIAALEEGA